MKLFKTIDRAVGKRSKLTSQTFGYAIVGILQGITFALLVPVLNSFLSPEPISAVPWLCGMAISSVAAAILLWVVTERGYHVSVEVISDGLMREIATHVSRLPLGWFHSGRGGQIATLITTGVQDVMNIPSVFLQQMTVALTTPTTVILVCFFIDWRLAVALLAVVPLGIWGYRWLQRSVTGEQKEEATSRMKVAAEVVEFAQAQQILRASGELENEKLRVDQILDKNHEDGRATLLKETMPMSVFNFIVEFGFILAFVVSTFLLLGGELSVGVFAAVLVLAARFVEPLTQVGAYGVALRKAENSLANINEVLSAEPLIEPEGNEVPSSSEVVFENVSFGYGEQRVLEDLNLTIPENSLTALVGPSGGGKSTVLRLISRFWDVNQGRVLIGGVDVRNISTPYLMNMISTVFQNPYLFDDTITANILIAKPDASEEQLHAAIEAAELLELADTLPKGLETRVGEGGHLLSGGERQRVAIARAFLKESPILLLDEVTAALDGEKEALVTEAMHRLSQDRTVVVIAHRLTTVAAADQIAVLENGQISELGSHDELLGSEGTYRRFWDDRNLANQWKIERVKNR